MTTLAAIPRGGRRSYCTQSVSHFKSEAVHIGTTRRNASNEEVFNNHKPAWVDHQNGLNSINNQSIATFAVFSKITVFSILKQIIISENNNIHSSCLLFPRAPNILQLLRVQVASPLTTRTNLKLEWIGGYRCFSFSSCSFSFLGNIHARAAATVPSPLCREKQRKVAQTKAQQPVKVVRTYSGTRAKFRNWGEQKIKLAFFYEDTNLTVLLTANSWTLSMSS